MSLFNILEERDIQIRGYRSVAARPAGRRDREPRRLHAPRPIVSPLKDRFGTQVRTHYPEELGDEIVIMDQEARGPAGDIPCGCRRS